MRIKILLSLLYFIMVYAVSYGQRLPLPYLRSVNLECTTTYDQNQRMFYYAYKIANGTMSVGDIFEFNIDISTTEDDVQYDTAGLRFEDDGFTEAAFRRHYSSVEGRIVPVGFPSTPGIWIAGLSNDLTAAFGADTLLINPGELVGGFVMMSRGLPGLRGFFAMPDFLPWKYFANADEYPDSAVDLDSVRHAINFYGRTIGPTAPPLNFSASSWIDTLVSYRHQCVTLGWLTNGSVHEKNEDDDKADEGIVERLDRKLDKAKAAIVKSDSVKARLELELFVKEVEQLYHKNKDEGLRKGVPSLTSEGYALLKYNAEYLIDRLPIKHDKGDDEKGRDKRK